MQHGTRGTIFNERCTARKIGSHLHAEGFETLRGRAAKGQRACQADLTSRPMAFALALDTPYPKRQSFESSLTIEAIPVKVNVSNAAFFYTQVLGHRLRWGAPRQGLPPCLGLRELQQLKDHPYKACVSWRCACPSATTDLTFLSLHATNFTVYYSTIDDVVGLLSRFEKGAMMANVDLKSAFRMVPIEVSEWNSRPLNGVPGL